MNQLASKALDLWLDLYWTVRDSLGNALTEVGWWCIRGGFRLSGYSIAALLKEK